VLAVKLTTTTTTTTTRRVSPVEDIATDPVAALFAGLTNLPKGHRREAINLDFHAVMHRGEDPGLEKHHVPRRFGTFTQQSDEQTLVSVPTRHLTLLCQRRVGRLADAEPGRLVSFSRVHFGCIGCI
jgi:hypothetical protein